VTITDQGTAGITITPTTGLTTTEAGGKATFTVQLNSQPTADVTVGLTSDNTPKEQFPQLQSLSPQLIGMLHKQSPQRELMTI